MFEKIVVVSSDPSALRVSLYARSCRRENGPGKRKSTSAGLNEIARSPAEVARLLMQMPSIASGKKS